MNMNTGESSRDARDFTKKIDKKIGDLLFKSMGTPLRHARILLFLNMMNHLYYDKDEDPSKDNQKEILRGANRFNFKTNSVIQMGLSSILMQQYARYFLLNRVKHFRSFFALTIRVSALYLKKGEMEEYAKAGYIMASKYYNQKDLETWDQIAESVFYNLGVIYQKTPEETKLALQCFLKTLKFYERTENGMNFPRASKKKINKEILKGEGINDEELCKTVVDSLKALEFSNYSVNTSDELPKTLNSTLNLDFNNGDLPVEEDITSSIMSSNIWSKASGPKILRSHEHDSMLKTHYETICNVLKLKLSNYDTIKAKFEFSTLNSVAEKIDNCRFFRDIAMGDTVVYTFNLKNQYYDKIQEELKTIKPRFYYLETIESTKRYADFTEEHLIPDDKLDQYVDFTIKSDKLPSGEEGSVEVIVTMLKPGLYRMASIEWSFFKVNYTYKLPSHDVKPFPRSNYTTIRAWPETGILEASAMNLKQDMYFGEIHKSLLCFKNMGQGDIEEAYLISCEPLFTGFSFKSLLKEPLAPGAAIDFDLFLRATSEKITMIPLFFLYKTKGHWRFGMYHFEVCVRKSFATKYHCEDLRNGRRHISIDLISNKENQHVQPEDVEACVLKINSNTWSIVSGSHKVKKTSQMYFITFEMAPIENPNKDTYHLARINRECFGTPSSGSDEIKLTDDSMEPFTDFLIHENIEMCRNFNKGMCREYFEISMLIKNKKSSVYYLRSLLNIPTRTIPVFPPPLKNVSTSSDPHGHRLAVKTNFLLDSKTVDHDFSKEPICEFSFKVQIDLSNLEFTREPYIYFRCLDALEKRNKSTGQAVVDINYENNQFSWLGKTKIKLSRANTTSSGRLSRERDWTGFERQLSEVTNIKHWAICDGASAEIWKCSPDFQFQTYPESLPKEGIDTIDEQLQLVKLFKAFGNVRSAIGIRLLGEKFMKTQIGYDVNNHFCRFVGEKCNLGGCIGRSGSAILIALFEIPGEEAPLIQKDPERQIEKIYQRLWDLDCQDRVPAFPATKEVSLRVAFSDPGCYELNNLAFYTSRNDQLQNVSEQEQVRICVRDVPQLV